MIGKVAGILLAAGASRRMGQPKLLLPWNGMPLVRHAAVTALAAGLDQLVVVTGFRSEHVVAALDGLGLTTVHNAEWLDGQSSSLRAGVAAVAEADAAIVLLSDQPLLRASTIALLIDTYRRTSAVLVAPRYGGRRGNPVLFDRSLFKALQAIEGDRGAREVIEFTCRGCRVGRGRRSGRSAGRRHARSLPAIGGAE